MMTNRETAKIYQFPAGGRAGLANQGKAKAEEEQLRSARVCFGGSWYHEEAVQAVQSEPSRKR